MQNPNPQTVSEETGMDTDVTTWALPEGAIARLGRGRVETLGLSPDGKYLAVGTWVGLWWYELATMKPVDLWETERGMISALEFSPNGALLATGNWDGGVKVWDVQNHRCLAKMQRTGLFDRASELVFSPDGQRLASSGGKYDAIYIWHPETGEQIAKFTVDEELQPRHRPTRIPLAFSPDGKFLIGATPENTFSVWDIETGERIAHLTGHSFSLTALFLSSCRKFLASVDRDGNLRKWEINKLTTNTSIPVVTSLPETINWVQYTFSPDSVLLAAKVSGTVITVSDVENNRKIATLVHKEVIQKVRFLQKGSQLVIVGTDTIQIWNIGDPTPQPPIVPCQISYPESLTFSPDGQTIATVKAGGVVVCWNVDKKQLKHVTDWDKQTQIHSVHISSTGDMRALGKKGNTSTVWNLGTDQKIATLSESHDHIGVSAFSSTGELWANVIRDDKICVWDGKGKETILEGHTGSIESIAFSPDEKRIATVARDATARVWDVVSGKEIVSLPLTPPLHTDSVPSTSPLNPDIYKGDSDKIKAVLNAEKPRTRNTEIKAITFSPCGNLIAGGIEGGIRLWDAKTYETRMVILLPRNCQRQFALAFSPCERYLASGAWWWNMEKVSIRLWDVATGENIVTFWGHPTDVQDLAFSPDGTLLASGSFDGTILLWDMKPYLPPIDTVLKLSE